ncbi:MAG: UDP-N-acetylmuramoyl-tripeptide--D-alanyl-D-alanine ligase [Rickettsiales bacterium]|jgi:UDP-N-acetylmuramoyl-tripeptide--D-alanyl-D-alanine ligase|nr:UDP-N-acetylmuramoyl-tripeptide--D-alanyl-D-alanine ligase [Rickettsiales bacterium]
MLVRSIIGQSVIFVSLFVFAFFRVKLLLLFFQQKEYRNIWFLKFIFNGRRLVDVKLTVLTILLYILNPYLILIGFLLFGLYENSILKKAKKKLVFTKRIKRIYLVSFILIALFINLVKVDFILFSAILTIQILPFILILSNIILYPYETLTQEKFLEQAKNKLKKINPIVIGITGSMGKTSTKYILSHILSGNLSVMFTPGSVNTKMGISSFINNKLEDNCKYFIVEMGAYFRGSIETLCDFVKPKYGIITAISDSHYEYFKTKENIISAKFELGESINKNNGILLINQNQIEKELIPQNIKYKTIGLIENIEQNKDGLYFKYNGNDVFAPIYGAHQAENIAICIEMASQIGIPMSSILATLKTLPQIEHRLQVIKRDNNITIIDNSYNSNFTGFKNGLDLLQVLHNEGGRKILITPGMVELGDIHKEQHYKIGEIAAQKVDIVILVNSERIPSFIEGFKETNKNAELIEFNTFSESQKWMVDNIRNNDVVLLENDLPDIYESKIKL